MIKDLNGTWKGVIKSTWDHPEMGKILDPIPAILTINQSGESISCTMRTEEMTSYSTDEQLERDNKTNEVYLTYRYQSNPLPTVKERSQPHEGTMKFTLVESPVRQLLGEYYTNRKTTGEIQLEFWTDKKYTHFPEDFEEHPAKIIDRYINLEKDSQSLTDSGQGDVILFVGVSPKKAKPLRLGHEYRDIKNTLRYSKYRDQFTLHLDLATTLPALKQAFLEYNPNIVHFSGHGNSEGIFLEDEEGNAHLIKEKDLRGLLQHFGDSLRCVILNSCDSKNLAEEIAGENLFVIGMKASIYEPEAIQFSIDFYMALGAGKDIESSFSFAVDMMNKERYDNKVVPMLIKPRNQ